MKWSASCTVFAKFLENKSRSEQNKYTTFINLSWGISERKMWVVIFWTMCHIFAFSRGLRVHSLLKAINDFQNEKSPGTHGLPAAFYNFFWKELHLDMRKSFNFAFDMGTLSISQRRGIITLIPKPNKDTTSL